MRTVDVLIAGGGPAGLAAAHACAGAGSILVVHKDKEIGRPVRTSGGSWKVHLDQLGVPPSLYHEIDSLTFAGPTVGATVTFGADRPVILDVSATYRYLAELAHDSGAETGAALRS
jgi:digeranylgeranylglycerophospholipid reductase